jgi:hypothetical protein
MLKFLQVCCFSFVSAAAIAQPSNESALVSHMPETEIEQFVVSELDVASFRSMLGPSRLPGQTRFADLRLGVSEISDNRVLLEHDFLAIVIQVLDRGDANNDGIEDLVVCFSEDAKEGTGRTSLAFIAQKYTENSPLVALAYDVVSRLRTICEGA